jgi:hypothetical protein
MGKENLDRILDQAVGADIEIANEAWFRYQAIVSRVAEQHGFPMVIGAAVFAALSPNNDYLGNLRDTARLLEAARAGQPIESFGVSTYGNNKRKAWRIAHGENPLDLIVFRKTRNFFLNVVDPTNPVPVTVDGHIFNAWTGERIPLVAAAQKLRHHLYDQVAEDIRQMGAERRLIPNVVQGIIWYAWKRLHRIRHTDQLEFWKPDFMIAGLGFESE